MKCNKINIGKILECPDSCNKLKYFAVVMCMKLRNFKPTQIVCVLIIKA